MVAWEEERGWARLPGGDRWRIAWTRPDARGPGPAVLLLPPLGPRSLCGPLRSAKPNDGISALVRGWADAGLVTMRVDPSGVGESEGPAYAELDLPLELAGYSAALASLRALPFVDDTRGFLFGASLGGFMAPLVSSGKRLRGVVAWGAPSRRWSEGLAAGARRQLALAGCAGASLEREASHAEQLYLSLLRHGVDPPELFAANPELAGCAAARDLAGDRLHGRVLRFFRQLEQVDPQEAWRIVEAPVLALQGEHDWVVAEDDHQRTASWPNAAGATSRLLPGLDHDLLRHPSREAAFARRGRGELDPAPSTVTLEWMRARGA